MSKNITQSRSAGLTLSRIIFWFCAFYFFLMGMSLILIPGFLVRGMTNGDIDQRIIGILRGAGGSILPYSLLYILIATEPGKRKWALYVLLAANLIAVILDLVSVIAGEYVFSNAMIDLPVEILSIIGVTLVFRMIKTADRPDGNKRI